MTSNTRTITLAIALLSGASTGSASPFRVGERVPSLELPAIGDGQPRSLDDFRGHKVMLHVWASW